MLYQGTVWYLQYRYLVCFILVPEGGGGGGEVIKGVMDPLTELLPEADGSEEGSPLEYSDSHVFEKMLGVHWNIGVQRDSKTIKKVFNIMSCCLRIWL